MSIISRCIISHLSRVVVYVVLYRKQKFVRDFRHRYRCKWCFAAYTLSFFPDDSVRHIKPIFDGVESSCSLKMRLIYCGKASVPNYKNPSPKFPEQRRPRMEDCRCKLRRIVESEIISFLSLYMFRIYMKVSHKKGLCVLCYQCLKL